MTREGRENRENARTVLNVATAYRNIAAAIFQSSVIIDGLTERDPAQDFITGILYNKGTICRHKKMGVWLAYSGNGKQDIYGEYNNYTLTGVDGTTYTAKRDQIEIYNANPQKSPLETFVRIKSATIASAEGAKRQNLDAVKKMTVIYCDDTGTANKLRAADAKRRGGAAVAIIDRSAKDYGGALDVLETGAEFMCDKLQDFQKREWETLLHYVGVYTGIEKSAEVKQSEIIAQNAETNAFMNVLLKTFNKCAEKENAPYRMRLAYEFNAKNDETGETEQQPEQTKETQQSEEKVAKNGI